MKSTKLVFLLLFVIGVSCAGWSKLGPPPPPDRPPTRPLTQQELGVLRLDETKEAYGGVWRCYLYNGNRDVVVSSAIFDVRCFSGKAKVYPNSDFPTLEEAGIRVSKGSIRKPVLDYVYETMRQYQGSNEHAVIHPLTSGSFTVFPSGFDRYEFSVSSAEGWSNDVYREYCEEVRRWQVEHSVEYRKQRGR